MNILTSILSIIQAGTEAVYNTVDSLASSTSVGSVVIEEELSMWELCLKGGIIMIPLLILSVISIYILVERFFAIRKAAQEDNSFMKKIKDYIHEGEIESAMNL